ncbi:hypothetical protein [Amycolatopsis sp. NPDC058986]|uniref:hypothetical protein n=1 Tax=unclassified Amycolatopsis TaxID=2618356 RepID=UPI0036701202
MKSLRARVGAGLAVGAAVAVLPLTAGAAFADDGPLVVAAGGYKTEAACNHDGDLDIANGTATYRVCVYSTTTKTFTLFEKLKR